MAAQTADPATPRDKPAPPAAAAPAAAATAGEQNKDEQPPRPADAAAAAGSKDGDKDAPADAEEDEADVGPAGTGSVVDMDVFGQLLEIDDDESHEFSKTLAFDYIAQADVTFNEIEEALCVVPSRSLT
ncbi:uncharacterized protein JCM10292_006686, partial [Rhodotorula paludigena]|uniref:uncharacterized protein n=1 Tax=Rhodotorula paludigena TaxID=86838 RepID=UPI00317EB17E